MYSRMRSENMTKKHPNIAKLSEAFCILDVQRSHGKIIGTLNELANLASSDVQCYSDIWRTTLRLFAHAKSVVHATSRNDVCY